MKMLALAAGVLLATIGATASAQRYYDRTYPSDPYYAGRAAGDECWNPRAGHYEGVRPGEVQNDLDFSRCRPMAGRYYGERRVYRDSGRRYTHECWNPREERWDVLHPGEIQDNLDHNQCRPYRAP